MGDPKEEPLLVEERGKVCILTLNRPTVKNAFNTALYAALAEELRVQAAAPSCHVVVLTGSGNVFSAGQDLREALEIDRTAVGRPDHNLVVRALCEFPKPLIGAVNGPAVGFGATMLLHCDLVIVAESARLRFPFVSLGIAPEAGATYLLPMMVGAQRAFHLVTSGRWMQASELVDAGCAIAVHPDETLLQEALRVADEIADQPLPSLLATKRLMVTPRRQNLVGVLDRERLVQDALVAQGDYRARFATTLGDATTAARR